MGNPCYVRYGATVELLPRCRDSLISILANPAYEVSEKMQVSPFVATIFRVYMSILATDCR